MEAINEVISIIDFRINSLKDTINNLNGKGFDKIVNEYTERLDELETLNDHIKFKFLPIS